MRRVPGTLVLGMAAMGCGMGLAAPARYEITVTARDYAVGQAPVLAELGRPAMMPRGASLRAPDGTRVPCQLVTDGEATQLVFV
ncbi:MAG TPA: hypothetical protein PLQ54_20245, partial [Armatimonadota bacterium]|nr:hypothetical protein [Armatimonadota bacterium]